MKINNSQLTRDGRHLDESLRVEENALREKVSKQSELRGRRWKRRGARCKQSKQATLRHHRLAGRQLPLVLGTSSPPSSINTAIMVCSLCVKYMLMDN